MMNMMTGAVAINGGVGVMEIHQPKVAVSQMAASAAQAAEQLGLELMILPSLQEMHFGDWEAVEIQRLYDTEPKALEQFWLQPTRFSPPNAETMQDFENREIGRAHV